MDDRIDLYWPGSQGKREGTLLRGPGTVATRGTPQGPHPASPARTATPSPGDRYAAAGLLRGLRRPHRHFPLFRADGGYTGSRVGWCRDKLAPTVEIVRRADDMTGLVVLPRRWGAERTFAWLTKYRL
ncbi:transposase [Streptomyces sp. NPDC006622]|uniref:transposase n=1 Tax=Streptomyces sp. NPDC006622 TaxID=3155459 RepID=UPI0033A38336